jgi:hypothetical protein
MRILNLLLLQGWPTCFNLRIMIIVLKDAALIQLNWAVLCCIVCHMADEGQNII